MGFGEVGADYCSYHSHKSKIERFELIWEYQNLQNSLFLKWRRSQTGNKYLIQSTEWEISWKVKSVWFNENYKEEKKYSKNNNDRAQEWQKIWHT